MKKLLYSALLLTLFSATLCACKKDKEEEDEGLLPQISFKTGSGYTSQDATMDQNTAFKIGINATKSEDKDVLTKFTITRSVDGGTASTVYNEDLSGGNGDSYSYDYTGTTMQKSGNEKYTFTVVNRDGLVNSVTLVLTIN